jgi:hypothetical protein
VIDSHTLIGVISIRDISAAFEADSADTRERLIA